MTLFCSVIFLYILYIKKYDIRNPTDYLLFKETAFFMRIVKVKKMFKIVSFIIVFIFAMFTLNSCTNEIEYSNDELVTLVKNPNVIVYSGETPIGGNINTRSNQEAPFWNGEAQVKPNDITEEERDKVANWFATHPDEVDGVEWPDFTNYYVQQLWYSDVMHKAKNEQSFTSQNCVVEIVTLEGENIFSGNDEFNKCRYIYNTTTTGFKYNNSAAGYWSTRYKIAYIDGYYYIGFDVEGKPDGDQDANLNQHFVNDPDGYYDDRIIKIVPADENGNPIYPKIDEPSEPSVPSTPDSPNDVVDENHSHKNEVEINLSADDKDGKYLESHLSIHVRHATDVEVFIPVPMEYYCEADDMAIVMKHEINHMVHGGPTELEYKLKDSELVVKLIISFEENGIRITTDGITQEVIDWCAEKCNGDGITFEIWNYFNEMIDIEQLKGYLNQSTVRFIDDEPDSYINAFNKNDDNTIYENDCTVSIVDGQINDYDSHKTGEHLNGSPYNEIFEKI